MEGLELLPVHRFLKKVSKLVLLLKKEVLVVNMEGPLRKRLITESRCLIVFE
jgi:hypothetical protein